MKHPPRLPHAPTEPLPELAESLAPFHVHFKRCEATRALERYLTGMFTEHPNKNCDTIAQVVPGTSEQSLQGLLTAMRWDEDDLNQQRVQTLLALPTEGDAALLFDDTGFAKQGKSSVGVARQYSGTLGGFAATATPGATPNCGGGGETRHKRYVAAVRKDFKVALTADGPAQHA